MAKKIVSSLMPIGLIKESSFGNPEELVDENDKVKDIVYPINQSIESPWQINEVYNKTQVSTAVGRQVQNSNMMRVGQHDVSGTVGHELGLNDFLHIGRMFFQNGYEATQKTITGEFTYITITDATKVGATKVGGTTNRYNITFDKELNEDIEKGEKLKIEIGGVDHFMVIIEIIEINEERKGVVVECDEDLTTQVNTQVETTLYIHKAFIEGNETSGEFAAPGYDCIINESYTIYQPNRFSLDATTSDVGASCSRVDGVVPTSLNIDFIAGNYSFDFIGKDFKTEGVAFDITSNYDKTTITNGYTNTNSGCLEMLGENDKWVELDTFELNCNISLNVINDVKTRRAGELAMMVVDGVTATGTYSGIYDDEISKYNTTEAIYQKRKFIQNGGYYRFSIKSPGGFRISIYSQISFNEANLNIEEGGWVLNAPFTMGGLDGFNEADGYKGIKFEMVCEYPAPDDSTNI